jgi:hypothetical protein
VPDGANSLCARVPGWLMGGDAGRFK